MKTQIANLTKTTLLVTAPLRADQHKIHFTGCSPDLGYSLDITYNLTVQAPPHHGPGPGGD
jgi:hypothetical protein